MRGGSVSVLTRRDWVLDTALAVAVVAVQVVAAVVQAAHRGTHVSVAGAALLVASGAVVAARRRWPVAVLAATYAATFGYLATADPRGAVWLSVTVAIGTAVYLGRRVAAAAFLLAGYAGFLWGPALVESHRAPSAVFALALGAGLLALLAGAEGVRLNRQRASAVAHGREQEMLRRLGEERLQIARDLHDVLAHSIAVINVQANTALHLMDRQPERARTALSSINDVSRQALTELRSLLAVLRRGEAAPPLAPAPALAHLADLAERAAGTGLRVEVEEHGQRGPLPAEVEVAAYRIVQEALTNTARHAGTGFARVLIDYTPDAVRVQVDDDGPGGPGGAARPGSGNGITGMTERAQALGGSLHAGRRRDGGFRVRAVLPVPGRAP